MKKEWLKDAFGTQMEIGDFVAYSTAISSISKREVVGATEKSIRVGYTSNYNGKHYTKCFNRERVALYERSKSNE